MKARLSLTLSPESAAHVRESAPDNASRYVDDLIQRAAYEMQESIMLLRRVGWPDHALRFALVEMGSMLPFARRPEDVYGRLHDAAHYGRHREHDISRTLWEHLIAGQRESASITRALIVLRDEWQTGGMLLRRMLSAPE